MPIKNTYIVSPKPLCVCWVNPVTVPSEGKRAGPHIHAHDSSSLAAMFVCQWWKRPEPEDDSSHRGPDKLKIRMCVTTVAQSQEVRKKVERI